MNLLVPTTASTSTDPQPDEWRFATSRAVHTSSREHDEPLVAVIAEGFAAVAVPWESATGLDAHDHGVAGSSVHFDGDHMRVVLDGDDVGATSVHVYSPPLRTIDFHRSTGRSALVIERVDGIGEYAS